MKDAQLRLMIADCLRYIKKLDEYYVQRENIEVHVDTFDTSYSGLSISDILCGIDESDYHEVYIRGRGDHYDDDSSEVELYRLRKQTDEEYFESLCAYILPTEYQLNQYQTYLRLKKQFGE